MLPNRGTFPYLLPVFKSHPIMFIYIYNILDYHTTIQSYNTHFPSKFVMVINTSIILLYEFHHSRLGTCFNMIFTPACHVFKYFLKHTTNKFILKLNNQAIAIPTPIKKK